MRAQFVYENVDFTRGQDPKAVMDVGMRRGYHRKIHDQMVKHGFKPIPEENWKDVKYANRDTVIDVYEHPSGSKAVVGHDPEHTSMFEDPPPQYDVHFNVVSSDGPNKEFGTGMFGPGSNEESLFNDDWSFLNPAYDIDQVIRDAPEYDPENPDHNDREGDLGANLENMEDIMKNKRKRK